jgi:hypothetical protein
MYTAAGRSYPSAMGWLSYPTHSRAPATDGVSSQNVQQRGSHLELADDTFHDASIVRIVPHVVSRSVTATYAKGASVSRHVPADSGNACTTWATGTKLCNIPRFFQPELSYQRSLRRSQTRACDARGNLCNVGAPVHVSRCTRLHTTTRADSTATSTRSRKRAS